MGNSMIISDTHFGNHKKFANYDEKGFNSRFLLQINALESALKQMKPWKVENIFHCGDVFHFRGRAEPEVVNKVVEVLDKYDFESCHILTGNHDITTEGEYFNSAQLLDGKCGGRIKVYSSPMPLGFGGVFMLPFTREAIEDVIDNNEMSAKDTVLFMHQSIIGSTYNGQVMTDGVDVSYLKKFKAVFCGHIHTACDLGKNVHIVGAPYQMTFGDDESKRVIIVDDKFRPIDELIPDHPKFISVGSLDECKISKHFYRIVTNEPITSTPSNTVVQMKVEHREQIRVSSSSPSAIMKAYCKNQNRPEMYQLGVELLECAKKEMENGND